MAINHWLDTLNRIITKKNLNREQMTFAMQQIMTGQISPVLLSAFFTAMRMKGITIEEITAAVLVMRSLSTKVSVNDTTLVDIVGTGGDGANLFNVSTASALIVAAAGAKVAKHGNYGYSSNSGSADFLKAAGVNLTLNKGQVAECIEQLGIGFMFAPVHHLAMKHVAAVRRELGFRTFMNLMGPLTNPAGVKRQLIGVYDKELCHTLAQVLHNTGSYHVMVVHSGDGLDEISPAQPTYVVELKAGNIEEYTIDPEAFNIHHKNLDGLAVTDAGASFALVKETLSGKNTSGDRCPGATGKARDMLALNAGAAIYVAGRAATLTAGVAKARDIIASGVAVTLLASLAKLSQTFTDQSPQTPTT